MWERNCDVNHVICVVALTFAIMEIVFVHTCVEKDHGVDTHARVRGIGNDAQVSLRAYVTHPNLYGW